MNEASFCHGNRALPAASMCVYVLYNKYPHVTDGARNDSELRQSFIIHPQSRI